MSAPEKFDEVHISLPNGSLRRLSATDFRKLSLTERIQWIMEKRIRYFMGGRELGVAEALKG